MSDLDLAERGQHGADVVEERPVRTHDEDPGPQQPVAERVQEPGRPVQPDRGLAGTRRPLHAYRRRGIGADDLVLLRLDRRDDVAHRADARALDLVDEDLAAPHVAYLGRDEVLVLVGGEAAVVHAEPAPEPHAHRLPARGPVERAGQLGAPVDDDRVAQLVVDVPPADVPALSGRAPRAVTVEPPEEQRRRRVVDEPGRAAGQGHREELVGHAVAAGRACRQGLLAHPGQLATGVLEVCLFAGQLVGHDRVLGHAKGAFHRWRSFRGNAPMYLWKAPTGQPVSRTRERRNRFPYPQPGRAARVILRSCFCEPRMMVTVTVSPTLRSWMLATSASEESIGLPSTAMTASCACRPA